MPDLLHINNTSSHLMGAINNRYCL